MISYNAVINVAAAWGSWLSALRCTQQLEQVGAWGLGFRVLGFGDSGLGFRVLGFGDWGLGFRV